MFALFTFLFYFLFVFKFIFITFFNFSFYLQSINAFFKQILRLVYKMFPCWLNYVHYAWRHKYNCCEATFILVNSLSALRQLSRDQWAAKNHKREYALLIGCSTPVSAGLRLSWCREWITINLAKLNHRVLRIQRQSCSGVLYVA